MGQDESKPQNRVPRPGTHAPSRSTILNPANAVATHFVIGDIDNDYFTVEHSDAISESSHHSNGSSSTNFQSNSPVNTARKRSSASPPPIPHGVKPPPLSIPSPSPRSPFAPNAIDSSSSSPDGAVRSQPGRPSSTRHEVTAPLPDQYNSKSCTNASSSSSFSLTAPNPSSRVRSNTSQEDPQARVIVFLECMFAALDSNGDGLIDIYDLLKWMENEPYYIKADPKTMCKTIYKRVNLQPDEKVRMNLKEWVAAFKDFKRCELERMAAQLAASNPTHFERSPPRVKPPPNSQQKLEAVAGLRQQAAGCHALHANRWRGFQQGQVPDRLARTSSTGATPSSPSVPSTASPRAFDDTALSSSDSSPSSPLAAQICVTQYPAPLSSRSDQEPCSNLRRAQSSPSGGDSHSPSPVPSAPDSLPSSVSAPVAFGAEGMARGISVICGEVKSSDLPSSQQGQPSAPFDQPSPSSSPLGQSRSTRATTRSSHALVCVPEHTELSPDTDSASPVSPSSPTHSARSISFPLFVSPRAPMLLPDHNPSELSLPTIDGTSAFTAYPSFAPVDGISHSLQVLYHALDQSDKSGACSRDHVVAWISRDVYFRRTENQTVGLEVLTRARALPSASHVTLQEFASVLEGLDSAVLDQLLANLARSTMKVPAKLQIGRSAKSQTKSTPE